VKVLRAEQLRKIDMLSGDTLTLMENAGSRVVEAIEERFGDLGELRVDILCGKGNNGGDGFVVARQLVDRGCSPRVALLAGEDEIAGDAAVNLKRLEDAGCSPVRISDPDDWEQFVGDGHAELVVDALLGTGVTRPVDGLYRTVIEGLRSCYPDAKVLSVDIPSGLAADNPQPIGPAIQADLTVTFTALKHCLVFPPAHRFAGDIIVVDIGTPTELLAVPEHQLHLITAEEFPDALHRRSEDTHKGGYGRVLVVGGSRGKSGAVAMAGQAALRSGAGLVTVATPSTSLSIVASSMPELMTEPLQETTDGGVANISVEALLKGKSVLALGPGLGIHEDTQSFVRRTVSTAEIPIVLDADGLNAFVGRTSELRGSAKRSIVVTPHPGEMARLIGRPIDEVQSNRLEVSRQFAVQHEVFVVLKGFRSLVATPDSRIFVNDTGNPGMATAGMGDILTGMIGGILAQETLGTFLQRLVFAVHLHGFAGDLAAEEIGEEPLVATDLLRFIGAAWERLRQ
jgi:NAD(P)H-hydrate epimerase